MDDELKQAIANLSSQLKDIKDDIKEIKDQTKTDHDTIIRLEGKTIELEKDIKENKDNESKFGRQFDERLKTQEQKVWKLYAWAAGSGIASGGIIGGIF